MVSQGHNELTHWGLVIHEWSGSSFVQFQVFRAWPSALSDRPGQVKIWKNCSSDRLYYNDTCPTGQVNNQKIITYIIAWTGVISCRTCKFSISLVRRDRWPWKLRSSPEVFHILTPTPTQYRLLQISARMYTAVQGKSESHKCLFDSIMSIYIIISIGLLLKWDNIDLINTCSRGTKWSVLTRWGPVTHICVGKLTIIGSDNGLSPGRRQAIIWTNAGIFLIGALGTNVSEILITIYTFSLKKIHLKMSSGTRQPSCLSLNVLTHWLLVAPHGVMEVCVDWYI